MTAVRFRSPLVMAALASAIACKDSVGPAVEHFSIQNSLVGTPVEVTTTAELIAALSPVNAGRRILVHAGTYDLTQPLSIPDSITLEGEGTMLVDESGLPAGFDASAHTTLRMIANVPGDVLTLGNQVTIRRLQIVDLPGRSGNVVAVYSRHPNDHVAASVLESEIVNANPGFYGLYSQTRNLNLGNNPPPDQGSTIDIRMTGSLVRSTLGGRGVFAFNFAPLSNVAVTLTGNVLGGLTANGGVSLPDAVHDSEVRIESRGNLYRNEATNLCAASVIGWNLTGGSGAPAPVPVSATSNNVLQMQSVDDRIERFTTAVLASGSRRYFAAPLAGESTDNELDMELIGATLSTPSCGGAQVVRDFDLKGAFANSNTLAPGNGNTLHAVIRGVTGSGARSNQYADNGGPTGTLPSQVSGIGNRLEIAGNPQAFMRTNEAIDPAPSAQFFSASSH
jgi:hypothetical protein